MWVHVWIPVIDQELYLNSIHSIAWIFASLYIYTDIDIDIDIYVCMCLLISFPVKLLSLFIISCIICDNSFSSFVCDIPFLFHVLERATQKAAWNCYVKRIRTKLKAFKVLYWSLVISILLNLPKALCQLWGYDSMVIACYMVIWFLQNFYFVIPFVHTFEKCFFCVSLSYSHYGLLDFYLV